MTHHLLQDIRRSSVMVLVLAVSKKPTIALRMLQHKKLIADVLAATIFQFDSRMERAFVSRWRPASVRLSIVNNPGDCDVFRQVL